MNDSGFPVNVCQGRGGTPPPVDLNQMSFFIGDQLTKPRLGDQLTNIFVTPLIKIES